MQENYNTDFYKPIADVENHHFWFIHRLRLIEIAIRKHWAEKKVSFIEIGAGTCFICGHLKQIYNDLEIYAIDLNSVGLKYGKKKYFLNCIVTDINESPFKIKFDIIGMFDVLEHIDDDVKMLQKLSESLKEDGEVILTVPAIKWMWSQFDELSGHKRRYSKKDLLKKLKGCNFEVSFVSFFNFPLVPIMTLVRKRKIKNQKNYNSEILKQLNPNFLINLFMKFIMNIERVFIKMGVKMPIGTSLLIVARKNER